MGKHFIVKGLLLVLYLLICLLGCHVSVFLTTGYMKQLENTTGF